MAENSKPDEKLPKESNSGNNTNTNLRDVKVTPTGLLWLVPIFMGLLGGILMYIAVKDHDQRQANDAILVGFLSSFGIIFLYFLIFAAIFSMSMPFRNYF